MRRLEANVAPPGSPACGSDGTAEESVAALSASGRFGRASGAKTAPPRPSSRGSSGAASGSPTSTVLNPNSSASESARKASSGPSVWK